MVGQLWHLPPPKCADLILDKELEKDERLDKIDETRKMREESCNSCHRNTESIEENVSKEHPRFGE